MIPQSIQSTIESTINQLTKEDRFFLIVGLFLIGFVCVLYWRESKRTSRILDSLTEESEKSVEREKALQVTLSEMSTTLRQTTDELSKSQSINEKQTLIVEQQQKYIERLADNEKMIAGMDEKLNQVLIRLAESK
ncbi:hypothetical protein [Listeria ilorinensis]|uniref:hypothetical protein n=1 Tax=Listeria ilorinensis TaxID=2867439 RepID=UPI001EF543FE|nr:hypothetical protein [Listeria ilorinensis]